MVTAAYISRLENSSVIGRQCMAVTCLERYCRHHGLHHPDVSAFIDHVWKVAQVTSDTFVSWETGFAQLTITGQGDPYSESLLAAIPSHLRAEFDRLTQHVFETSATTWYGDALEDTRLQLIEVLRVVAAYGIALPEPERYLNAPISQYGGWGPALTDDQLRTWRRAV